MLKLLRVLILLLIGKYCFFISRLGLRNSGPGLTHRAINKILHLVCPTWFMRWFVRSVGSESGFDKEGGLEAAQRSVELMPDETLNELVASIRDGTMKKRLEEVWEIFPELTDMGITQADFIQVIETEKFFREHRERYKRR